MAPISSIFFASDSCSLRSLILRGHGVTLVRHPETLLQSLQAAAPELVVLDAGALLGSGLGLLAALKAAPARSGATVLLLGEHSGSLTVCAASAVGAHAAFRPGEPTFAEAAERLCARARAERVSERVAA